MLQSDGMRDQCMPGSIFLILLVSQLFTHGDAALVVTPRNSSALLGTSVTLHCSTDLMSTPVNWYCSGTCSANTTATVAYLLMAGVLTESYADRVSIVESNHQKDDGVTAAHYDIHIDPVMARDDGVYTCVDNAGIGVKASASLSVLPPSTSQPSPTTRLSSTASSTTTRPYFTTHAAEIPARSTSMSPAFVAAVVALTSLIIIVVFIAVFICCRQQFADKCAHDGKCALFHRRRPSTEEDNSDNQRNPLRRTKV